MSELKKVEFTYTDKKYGEEILEFGSTVLNSNVKLDDGAYSMLQIISHQVTNQLNNITADAKNR